MSNEIEQAFEHWWVTSNLVAADPKDGFIAGFLAVKRLDTSKVTRVEVISQGKGRDYVNMDTGNVELSLQDDGKTLKIFIEKLRNNQTNNVEQQKHKLSDIINTDCYIQFDSNEELREWVKKAGIEIDLPIMPHHTVIWLSRFDNHMSLSQPHLNKTIYHHTNIEI